MAKKKAGGATLGGRAMGQREKKYFSNRSVWTFTIKCYMCNGVKSKKKMEIRQLWVGGDVGGGQVDLLSNGHAVWN